MRPATLSKKETLAQAFSREFCENSKNTFFTERLWATASVNINIFLLKKGLSNLKQS